MDQPIQQRCAETFVASVENLFKTMLKQTVEAGTPQPGPSALADKHVRATIRLSGDVMGSVSLLMPEAASLEAITGFVGKKVAFGSADFRDAVGELLNMIAGGAVSRIGGLKIRIACPSVQMGPVAAAAGAAATDTTVGSSATTAMHLPFTGKSGVFVIELLMTEIGSAAKAA